MPDMAVKRATSLPDPRDGMRVLVDRRWPPGRTRNAVAVDLWLREAAPSEALRRWYGRDVARWPGFIERYRSELRSRADLVRLLRELQRRGPVTLLHGARDPEHNNATALRRILDELA
jgi:uncharacterized protein YeaO (DUF488 family)